jgi:hypothetical protein
VTGLLEFLLARIAEDEQAAALSMVNDERMTAAAGPLEDPGPVCLLEQTNIGMEYVVGMRSARLLAECKAKRRIVEEHPDINDGDCGTCVHGQWGYPAHGGALPERWPCPTLRFLALPYADHPDYEEGWRP